MEDAEDPTIETAEATVEGRAIAKKELARDLIAFAGTVAAVIIFDWKTKDMIWGLWVSSLIFGYTTIVVTIFAPAFRAGRGKGVGMAIGGLFLLAFFTVHFGGFHFGHAVFLNAFFPLIEGGDGFANPFALTQVALTLYWPMLLATFVSRFSDLPLKSGGLTDIGKDMIMKPYANVIRMHILIFVFAGLHGVNLGDYAIYPVLLFYFFPWRAFFWKKAAV